MEDGRGRDNDPTFLHELATLAGRNGDSGAQGYSWDLLTPRGVSSSCAWTPGVFCLKGRGGESWPYSFMAGSFLVVRERRLD